MSARKSVVLPEPDGPIRLVTRFFVMSKVQSRTAVRPWNETDTSLSCIAAAPRGTGVVIALSVVCVAGAATFVSTFDMNSWSIGYLACCFLDAQIRALKLKTNTNTTRTSAIPHTSVRKLGHSDLAFS